MILYIKEENPMSNYLFFFSIFEFSLPQTLSVVIRIRYNNIQINNMVEKC